jgi:hypothetical protein
VRRHRGKGRDASGVFSGRGDHEWTRDSAHREQADQQLLFSSSGAPWGQSETVQPGGSLCCERRSRTAGGPLACPGRGPACGLPMPAATSVWQVRVTRGRRGTTLALLSAFYRNPCTETGLPCVAPRPLVYLDNAATSQKPRQVRCFGPFHMPCSLRAQRRAHRSQHHYHRCWTC